MYYFVNTSINPKKSGIEHAEMKRLALFNQHHVPAKMVTRFFSLSLHQTLTAAGIAAENFGVLKAVLILLTMHRCR